MADIVAHSPVRPACREACSAGRERTPGLHPHPPRLQGNPKHIPFELSDSPFNIPSCLITTLSASRLPALLEEQQAGTRQAGRLRVGYPHTWFRTICDNPMRQKGTQNGTAKSYR